MAYLHSIFICIFLFLAGHLLKPLPAPPGNPSPPADPASLAGAFSTFEQDAQLRYGIAAISVLDARTGEPVFIRNGNTGMVPASTLKTITSITSLHLLGPAYRYRTVLQYTGAINPEGTLRGDLIIRGSGDPTLGSSRWPTTTEKAVLENWADAVKKAGIRRVEGRIIGDQSRMGTQSVPGGWQWDDIGNYYGAGSSALNWRENQFDILLRPTQVGGPVQRIGTRPEMDYLDFVNELTTGPAGTGDRAYVYLPPYRDVAYLRGTFAIDAGKPAISAALPDPAFDCAYRFLQVLESNGIAVSGKATTDRRLQLEGTALPGGGKELGASWSPMLSDIIREFNDHSINLYGESLVKTLAIENGKQGSTPAGIRLIREFWADRGIDSASLVVDDGSGLSPANRVTVSTMSRILQDARKASWFGDFYEALPVQNGMRMKSGFIQGVRGYAGYHTARSGREYTFAFIVNNYNGSGSAMRRKMWSILDHLK